MKSIKLAVVGAVAAVAFAAPSLAALKAGDKAPELLYMVTTKGKQDEPEGYALKGLKREKSGTFVPFRWGQADAVPIAKRLSASPTALKVVDVNRDGQADSDHSRRNGPGCPDVHGAHPARILRSE